MADLKRQKTLSVLNLASVIVAIVVNYISQIGAIQGNTVSSVSDQYFNLFTPAGYAFSIWGIIYIALLALGTYQVYQSFVRNSSVEFITQSGYWFVLANLANAAWIFAWLSEMTLLSVFIMLVILISLIKIILNTNMERWDAPRSVIAFSWWPISLYAGWISVATIANIAAYLVKIGWRGDPLDEVLWTIIMLVVATVLNLLMIYLRNMREFAVVGVWALMAIFARHEGEYVSIAYVALIEAIIIFIYIMYHGFKNRRANPFFKSEL